MNQSIFIKSVIKLIKKGNEVVNMSLGKGYYVFKSHDVLTILPVYGEDPMVFCDVSGYHIDDNAIVIINNNGQVKEIPTE